MERIELIFEKINQFRERKIYKWIKLPFIILQNVIDAFVLSSSILMILILLDESFTNTSVIISEVRVLFLMILFFMVYFCEMYKGRIYKYIKNNLMKETPEDILFITVQVRKKDSEKLNEYLDKFYVEHYFSGYVTPIVETE